MTGRSRSNKGTYETTIGRQSMQEIKKILVVSRLTKCCEETIKYGISLAWQYGAELYIIYLPLNPHDLEERNLPSVCSLKEIAKASANAKASLDWILRNVRIGGQHVKELTREGDPVEEILKTIATEKIDLVVLHPAEESQPELFLFGRITEELVRLKPSEIIFMKKKPLGSDRK